VSKAPLITFPTFTPPLEDANGCLPKKKIKRIFTHTHTHKKKKKKKNGTTVSIFIHINIPPLASWYATIPRLYMSAAKENLKDNRRRKIPPERK
jgi:hypothetical protein